MHEQTQEITDLILKAAEKARAESSQEAEPSMTSPIDWPVQCNINRGLDGAIACETRVGYVNGAKGWLIYRGYDIFELTAHASFEEVCFLLLRGHLPSQAELDQFTEKLRGYMQIDETIKYLKQSPVAKMGPMAALSLGVNMLRVEGELNDELESSMRLIAAMPVILGAITRIRAGEEPVSPDASLGLAANLLYMMTGEKPDAEQERLMDIALTLHADHGSNASTFTAMVVASTLSDMHFAVCAGIGALKGPLHGGANEAVIHLLGEIKSVDEVPSWYHKARAEKRKIMGFGHRVYKAYDPRARIIRPLADHLTKKGKPEHREMLEKAFALEKEVIRTLGEQKGIFPNVDFFSGTVYTCMGIAPELFTPIFAVARVVGWTARVLEYTEDNRLFRPRASYIGSTYLEFKNIADRGECCATS